MAAATTMLSERTLWLRKNWQRPGLSTDESARKRRWIENNRERSRAKVRDQMARLRTRVIKYLGGKCVRCEYNANEHALQVDHINGDGHKDRENRSGYNYYWKILRGALGYQLLCANCNVIKKFDNREFGRSPHKID